MPRHFQEGIWHQRRLTLDIHQNFNGVVQCHSASAQASTPPLFESVERDFELVSFQISVEWSNAIRVWHQIRRHIFPQLAASQPPPPNF